MLRKQKMAQFCAQGGASKQPSPQREVAPARTWPGSQPGQCALEQLFFQPGICAKGASHFV